jgi:hypothetical protein
LPPFPDIPGRASLETPAVVFPGLVSALANDPGIGFVLVRSDTRGPLANVYGWRQLSMNSPTSD